jgi:hypothetical protein
MRTPKSLSVNQWAIICTLRQYPAYKLVENEGAMAERMVARGLLTRMVGQGKYLPTELAYRLFHRRQP